MGKLARMSTTGPPHADSADEHSADPARTERATHYRVLPGRYRRTPAVHEREIKRSRFIGYLVRVETEEQAREVISGLRREHHLARHVCSAFILGADRGQMRSNDDGEPAGTAGAPMLEALSMRETGTGQNGEPTRELSDVLAVVVRYFGGVKLGAGGLVRAYSDAVSQTLDTVGLVSRQRMMWIGVEAPHAEAGRWENDLRGTGHHLGETSYGATSATLSVAVPDEPGAVETFNDQLASLTAGAASGLALTTEWTDVR